MKSIIFLKENKLFLIKYLLLPVCIILSVFYGEVVIANIGSFKDFMVFGTNFNIIESVLIPLTITLGFCISFLFIFKTLDNRKRTILYFNCLMAFVSFIYMTLLIMLKNNEHLYSALYLGPGITLVEKIQGIFCFLLLIFIFLSFSCFFEKDKFSSLFLKTILFLIMIYSFSSIVYSLCTEFDKYVYFLKSDNIFDKNYESWIKSFYAIGNVFGHTVFFGCLCSILLFCLTRKITYIMLSIIQLPFIIFSGCRATIGSTLIFFFALSLFFIYKNIKSNKNINKFFSVMIIGLYLFFILDLAIFRNVKINIQDVSYDLQQLINKLVGDVIDNRIGITSMVYNKANLIDVLFGCGYELNFVIPRTYGFFYYLHNTFAEVLLAGGIPLFAFFVIINFCSLKYIFDLRKKNQSLFIVLLSSFIGIFVYGFFESMPMFFLDFFGIVIAFIFFLVPKLLKT